jgi:chromosome segregation and condensation protein ScpB
MKNGKHKVRVQITATAMATVIFRNNKPIELDELQEILEIHEYVPYQK